MFESEWATYQAKKPELLAREGQYVVIRGNEVLGVYPTIAEAFGEGVRAYRSERFFLHRISKDEPAAVVSPFMSMAVKDSSIQYPAL